MSVLSSLLSSALARLCKTLETVKLWYIVAVIYVKFTCIKLLTHLPEERERDSLKITKVLIFDETRGNDSWELLDVTGIWKRWAWNIEAINDPNAIDDILEHFGKDWRAWKVEIRYTDKENNKYRILARNESPPPTSPHPQHHVHDHIMHGPRGILAASLVPMSGGEAREVDVTRRLVKYAGPSHDFHQQTVVVKDIFPLDDHDDNRTRFGGIKVIAIQHTGKLVVRHLNYDDVVSEILFSHEKKMA
jgi:hypothetical protein